MAIARRMQPTGAKGIVSGAVSNGATWLDTISLSENETEVADADVSTWKMVFKQCDGGSVCLTLTSGAELTITQNAIETLITIEVAPGAMTNLCGDYYCDLAQLNPAGQVIHWLNGIVTFIDENLGF